MNHKGAFTAPRVAGSPEHSEVAEADGEARALLAGSRDGEWLGEEVSGELEVSDRTRYACVHQGVSQGLRTSFCYPLNLGKLLSGNVTKMKESRLALQLWW